MVRAGGTRTALRAARRLAVVAMVAVTAAACAPSTTPDATPSAGVAVSDADCLAPQVLGRLGLTLDPSLAATTTDEPEVTAGRVPDGFVPVGVLVCQVGGQMRDSAGTWTAVTATSREGSAADMSALGAGLDAAAGPRPGTDASGTASPSCGPAGSPVVLWLLDAMDRAVLSDVAIDGCDETSAQVRAALDRMPVTGTVDHPVQLVAPAQPVTSAP